MEGRPVGPSPADERPRASPGHRQHRVLRRSIRNSSSYDPEAGHGCSAHLALHQDSEAQQLNTSCAAGAISSDSGVQVRQPASDPLTKKKRPGRGCRTRTKNVSRHRAGRLSSKRTTSRDSSRSHSRSDTGGTSGSGVDAKGDGGGQDNSVGKKDVARRDIEDTSQVIPSSGPSLHAERAQVAAAPTARSAESGSFDPDVARKTVPSSFSPAPLAFSEAVDPFSSYPPQERRRVLRRLFPYIFFFTEKTPPSEPSPLPSFFASLLALIKEKVSLIPPALAAPLTLLLLFTYVALSLLLLLLLAPLRQASSRLFTQLSYDWSPARTNYIRYCQQSRPLEVKSQLPVVDDLSLLPLPAEDLTRITGRQTAKTDCHACPEHAVCAGGRMKCLPHYVRVSATTAARSSIFTTVSHVAKKLFRRELNEGDVCVENVVAKRAAEKVVERILLLLRKRAGDAQCGSPICDKISPNGQSCVNSTELQKNDFNRRQKQNGKNLPPATDGTMTRWELLQSEELREQLKDDSVYAFVFDRFLEKKAALRLNVEVKQQYSFESMILPRDDVSTSSASNGVSHDDVVAFFLQEQRRSQGITYSYTYVGPHALRPPFCTFRLIFMNTLVPLSVFIIALSALAIPVAVWLRRFHLRRQLLTLMQQQQGEQQMLMKSTINAESDAIPVVYCGCSSAHLSQLLVQHTAVHRFSLLRWWLQRTATNIEEVDAMCFELLHNKSNCVQTVSHEGQNFWWVGKDISPHDQHTTADSTRTNTCCPQALANVQAERLSTSLNSCQTTSGLFDTPAAAPHSLLSPHSSMFQRLSSSCASCPRPSAHVDACSSKKCEPNHARNGFEGTRSVQQADASMLTMRCRASIPGSGVAASTRSSSAATATADPLNYREAISPFVSDSRKTHCVSCSRSNAGRYGQRAVTGQATGSQWMTEVNKLCHHSNNSGSEKADLNLPRECASLRRTSSRSSTDFSFSAFLARVSDMQRKTPGRNFRDLDAANGDGESPHGAAGVVRGRSSVL